MGGMQRMKGMEVASDAPWARYSKGLGVVARGICCICHVRERWSMGGFEGFEGAGWL